jgi:hypothetical protein
MQHPLGTDVDTLTKELAAWQWAIDNIPTFTLNDFANIHLWFGSYWKEGNRAHYRYFADVINQMVSKRFF